MKRILVIHGPNLGMLGRRQPDLYGTETLYEINKRLRKNNNDNLEIICRQSDSESEIIKWIHGSVQQSISTLRCDTFDFLVINAAGYTHTSVAIRDSLLSVDIPFIEVHITNIYKRESFRHVSMLSDIASGVIIGHGSYGYDLAIMSALNYFNYQNDDCTNIDDSEDWR